MSVMKRTMDSTDVSSEVDVNGNVTESDER